MAEFRRGQLQRAIEQQLPEGREEQVGATHHFGDPHGRRHPPRRRAGRPARRLFARRRNRQTRPRRRRAADRRTDREIAALHLPERGNASSFPPDLPRQASLGETAGRCPDRSVLHPRGGGSSRAENVAARAIAGIDQAAVAQFFPSFEIEWATFALQNGVLPPNAGRTSASPRRERHEIPAGNGRDRDPRRAARACRRARQRSCARQKVSAWPA